MLFSSHTQHNHNHSRCTDGCSKVSQINPFNLLIKHTYLPVKPSTAKQICMQFSLTRGKHRFST